MELPFYVRALTEELALGYSLSELRKNSSELTDKYRNGTKDGRRLSVSDRDALVYSLVRMPATFAAVYCALSYAAEGIEEDIRSVFDAGAGTGAAGIAAAELFPVEELVCVEREPAMRRLGKRFFEYSSHQCLRAAEWIFSDLQSIDADKKRDLVTASYMLNEMNESDREASALKLWEMTEKLLVIIEPGTPEGYRQLMDARKTLISAGAYISAPCMHSGECPLKEDDWCHFSARVQRSRIHKQIKNADAPYEDEKFFYMAFSRTPPEKTGERILRHPVTEKGRITLTLCGENGIRNVTVTKKQKEAYRSLRHSKWGDNAGVFD